MDLIHFCAMKYSDVYEVDECHFLYKKKYNWQNRNEAVLLGDGYFKMSNKN